MWHASEMTVYRYSPVALVSGVCRETGVKSGKPYLHQERFYRHLAAEGRDLVVRSQPVNAHRSSRGEERRVLKGRLCGPIVTSEASCDENDDGACADGLCGSPVQLRAGDF